jgi:uncharacterized protein
MATLPKSPVHIISDGRYEVEFSATTMTGQLLRTFPPTGDRPPGSEGGDSRELRQKRYHELLKSAGAGLPERKTAGAVRDQVFSEKTGCLDRLVLNVSHDCNLRCLYCYAQGGAYGTPPGPMSRGIAFSSIDWVLKAFGGIDRVQFFGGEPLLNPQLIIEVCEYFQALAKSKSIKEIPRFGLVTNGTLGNSSIIKLLRHYQMAVTISLDGPEEIQDFLRGKGSFAKADRFTSQCLEAGDILTDFECTWTGIHSARGISVVELMNFFHDRYGVGVLHVVPVSASSGHPLELDDQTKKKGFQEAARYSVRSLAAGRILANSLSHRVLHAFAQKEPVEQYCPAGQGVLSVGAEGGLYPCFMFTGNPLFCICRFGESGEVFNLDFARVSSLIQSWDKSHHEECLSCWASPFCSGCMGADYLYARDVKHRLGCGTMKIIAETILLEVASLLDQ